MFRANFFIFAVWTGNLNQALGLMVINQSLKFRIKIFVKIDIGLPDVQTEMKVSKIKDAENPKFVVDTKIVLFIHSS